MFDSGGLRNTYYPKVVEKGEKNFKSKELMKLDPVISVT